MKTLFLTVLIVGGVAGFNMDPNPQAQELLNNPVKLTEAEIRYLKSECKLGNFTACNELRSR